MNNDTTLQQLRGALLALYSPDVPVSVRNEADAFLQAFLFSRDCWSISLTLIRSSDAAFFEQLFAARALHQRLRCSVIKSPGAQPAQASHQVIAAEEWSACREALIVLAMRYSNQPECRPIVTQLCMALAALAAKMETWNCDTLVKDVGQALGGSAQLALVEVLRMFPEEIESSKLSVHPDRRVLVRVALQASTRRALDMLDEVWRQAQAQNDSRLAIAVLQATTAWLDFAPRDLHPVVSQVSFEALLILAAPQGIELPPGAQMLAQHPDGISSLVAVLCASGTSHAKAGASGAQPLLQMLQPVLDRLLSDTESSTATLSPQTEAQLTVVSHAAVEVLETSLDAAAAGGLVDVLLRHLGQHTAFCEAQGVGWKGLCAADEPICVGAMPAFQPFTFARDLWDAMPTQADGGGGTRAGSQARRKAKNEAARLGMAHRGALSESGGTESLPTMTKEERRGALRAALQPVAPLLVAIVGRMMAFPQGLWQETWEFDGGVIEREGDERHAMTKGREDLADVVREAAVVVGVGVVMAQCRIELKQLVETGSGWEHIEGFLWALYAVSKEYCRTVAADGVGCEEAAGRWPVQNLVECLKGLWERSGVEGPHPRMQETVMWILQSIAPVLMCKSPGAQETGDGRAAADSAGALLLALELTYKCLDSPRPATARGAAVAFMKISEHCGASVVALGGAAYERPLCVFRAGGPATVPLRQLRHGREAPNLVVLRGLLSLALALPGASESDAAFATLSQALCESLLCSLDEVVSLKEKEGQGEAEEWEEAVAAVAWKLRSHGVLVEGAAGVGAVGVGKVAERSGVGSHAQSSGRPRPGAGCSSEGRWRLVDIGLQVLHKVVDGGIDEMWLGEVGEGAVSAAAEAAWSLLVSIRALVGLGEADAGSGREAAMLLGLLNVCGKGWEKARGVGGYGGSAWLAFATKAVDAVGDVAGEMALVFCSGVTPSMETYFSLGGGGVAGEWAGDIEVGENLAVHFLRCLSMCMHHRVSALGSAPALREAGRCVLMSLRGTSGRVALAAMEAAKSWLLLLPAPPAARGSSFDDAASLVLAQEGGGAAVIKALLEGANGCVPTWIILYCFFRSASTARTR